MGNALRFLKNKIERDKQSKRLKVIKKIDVLTLENNKYLSVNETSAYVKLSVPTLSKMRSKTYKHKQNLNFIPFIKKGRSILYLKKDVDFFLENRYEDKDK